MDGHGKTVLYLYIHRKCAASLILKFILDLCFPIDNGEYLVIITQDTRNVQICIGFMHRLIRTLLGVDCGSNYETIPSIISY